MEIKDQIWMVSSMSSDDVWQTSLVKESEILNFLTGEAGESSVEGNNYAEHERIAAACHADFIELKETEGNWYAFELQMNGIAYYFQKLPNLPK